MKTIVILSVVSKKQYTKNTNKSLDLKYAHVFNPNLYQIHVLLFLILRPKGAIKIRIKISKGIND